MSVRGRLIELAKDLPKLTAKQREVLICVHPYLGGMTHKKTAKLLCVSQSAIEDRLAGIFKRIPWLQADMRRKRKEEAVKRESLRRPNRIWNAKLLSNDGLYDTFHGERIVRKF